MLAADSKIILSRRDLSLFHHHSLPHTCPLLPSSSPSKRYSVQACACEEAGRRGLFFPAGGEKCSSAWRSPHSWKLADAGRHMIPQSVQMEVNMIERQRRWTLHVLICCDPHQENLESCLYFTNTTNKLYQWCDFLFKRETVFQLAAVARGLTGIHDDDQWISGRILDRLTYIRREKWRSACFCLHTHTHLV